MIILILLSATLTMYAPILAGKIDLFSRGNDLQEFFWPIIYYVKHEILVNHTFPLWNKLFLSGTPLLPDPQSPLFYIPNFVFLLLPINIGFLFLFILHTFVGGLGIYFACSKGFRFSKTASIFAGTLYITTPRLAGYLEAGHVGLVYAMAWLPYVVWTSVEVARKPKFLWTALLAISMAALYYTHAVTFAIAAVGSTLLVATTTLFLKSNLKKVVLSLTLSGIFTFGLTAVQLLPQLEWIPQTTRSLLLKDRDVYPKWETKTEFLQAIFVPWINGWQDLWQIDTEKWLAVGIIPTSLAFWGFWKLQRKYKVALLLFGLPILLLLLNNISPIYNLLLTQDWYVLMRVSTRNFFIFVLLTVFIFGYTLDKFTRKSWIFPLATLAILESLFLSWAYLLKPLPSPAGRFVPEEVYQFLAKDDRLFRVFCVNRCLSQQESARFGLELAEGYNTFQQENYFEQFIQISQVYWKKYTLALPPFSIYQFRQIQPFAPSLADFNIKYVVSPHPLTDPNLMQEFKAGGYWIYRNALVLERAYFEATLESSPILKYSPNKIVISTERAGGNVLVVSEVWSPGWNAYLNGKDKTEVLETKSHTRMIKIDATTRFVELKYEPENFKLGLFISGATFISLLAFLVTGLRPLSFKRLFS